MIACQQGFLFAYLIAEVIAAVARRVHGLDGPAVAFDELSVLQRDVGDEARVATGLDLDAAFVATLAMRPKTIGAGARALGYESRRRGSAPP